MKIQKMKKRSIGVRRRDVLWNDPLFYGDYKFYSMDSVLKLFI
jgi:hypothetical protein